MFFPGDVQWEKRSLSLLSVKVYGKDLGRWSEEMLPRKQSGEWQHSQQLDSGWNKKLRRDSPSFSSYKWNSGRFVLLELKIVIFSFIIKSNRIKSSGHVFCLVCLVRLALCLSCIKTLKTAPFADHLTRQNSDRKWREHILCWNNVWPAHIVEDNVLI